MPTRIHRLLTCAVLLALISACGGGSGGGGGGGGADSVSFTHTATALNIAGNATIFDNPALNGVPGALPLVTHNWNPGGGIGVYVDHPFAVYYTGTNWGVFNSDGAAMPLGASFNVALPTGPGVFVHTATALNVTIDRTLIDNPYCNGHSSAVLRVTRYWDGLGSIDPHPFGVRYSGSNWSIFNEDGGAMPLTASFLVAVTTDSAMEFVHWCTPTSVSGNGTLIDDPRINGDAFANIQATQVWVGVPNGSQIGVYYNGWNWLVFNENLAAMPLGAAFNVRIEP